MGLIVGTKAGADRTTIPLIQKGVTSGQITGHGYEFSTQDELTSDKGLVRRLVTCGTFS